MKEEMIYQDQSPNALHLTLIEGNLDKRQFLILGTGTECAFGLRVEAAVIGASHCISFSHPMFQWHEVFACVQAEAPNVVACFTLDELHTMRRPYQQCIVPQVNYLFTVNCVPWLNGERTLQALEAQANTPGIGLTYTFPIKENDCQPKTVVAVSFDEVTQSIAIETAHTYPNADAMVFTSSALQLVRRPT
jgi:hypothetical protein